MPFFWTHPLWKSCTHTSVCDIAVAVRKFIAYESSRALEYEIFTRTKISTITVVQLARRARGQIERCAAALATESLQHFHPKQGCSFGSGWHSHLFSFSNVSITSLTSQNRRFSPGAKASSTSISSHKRQMNMAKADGSLWLVTCTWKKAAPEKLRAVASSITPKLPSQSSLHAGLCKDKLLNPINGGGRRRKTKKSKLEHDLSILNRSPSDLSAR